MKKLFSMTLLAMIVSFVSFAQVLPIAGVAGCCVGAGSYLMDSTTGGTWSSSNVAVGTVSTTGYVTGISAGTCTISYIVGASYATYGFTVSPTPATITGPSSVCVGATITAIESVPGGVWSSNTPARATISGSGVIWGVSSGTAQVVYTMGTGCAAYFNFTVGSATIPVAIVGSSTVCLGSTITLTDATPGGVWSSVTPSIATISGVGVVTGVAVGTDTIHYTLTGACGSAFVSKVITVTSTVSAGTISGPSTVIAGSNITLTDGVSGGTWTSSNTAIATVGASTGIVSGVSVGVATITYTVTGCGGTAFTTQNVTVNPVPPVNRISGHVFFTGVAVDSAASVKIWLIHYNPTTHMLTAVDSVTTTGAGPSTYYVFTTTAVTDSYRIKAAYFPPTFSSTGYVPTYHNSSFYWYLATVFAHTDPSIDDNMDITMAYGTVTAGPGFIAGDVTTGANKGTTTTAPAVNMLVLALNTTGGIMAQAYTDATGHYSFSNLPVGTYTIHPEDINYNTTNYAGINLTTGVSSMTTAHFGQHSLSKTILPITTGINNLSSSVSALQTYPNPTNGKLNLQWNEYANETGSVSVSDITGREVYSTTINLTQGNGSGMLDLTSLNDGVYLISVTSGTINYNNKIQIQH